VQKILKFLVLFMLPALLLSCAGSCLKVGGSYKDVAGDIEYCFNAQKSKDAGVPAIDGEGQTFFGITGEQIKEILEKLKDKAKDAAGIKSVGASSPGHPVKQLLLEIKR
jgi:hypothetical protein